MRCLNADQELIAFLHWCVNMSIADPDVHNCSFTLCNLMNRLKWPGGLKKSAIDHINWTEEGGGGGGGFISNKPLQRKASSDLGSLCFNSGWV